MTGFVEAVCVVHADVPVGRRSVVNSAIDKRPVAGAVDVHELGLAGDHSSDTKFHGGIDQAVYAYDDAEAQRWSSELGREIPPGWFGENLRTVGVPVTDAVIGSSWRIGTTLLEVTIARRPCGTFARWVDEPRWVRRFTERGDVGAYLKVVEPGLLAAGDPIVVESVPEHGVTVRTLFEGNDVDGLKRLLETPNLAVKVERDVRAALGVRSKS
ncbi:MOSC domain-containing protein [Rhodococcoides yunnanense]|uniref:MOSC domain-containing protein n=1 Tax=Rhodococcoides yunnanense TaxID=278209 RepID=UPI0009325E92|nr:MOSC domain-containing protein [Rhodococcus yunnanensis]